MSHEITEGEPLPWISVSAVHHSSIPPWIPHQDYSAAMFAAQRRALTTWPRDLLADHGIERVHITLEFGADARPPRIRRLSATSVQVRWFGSLAEQVLAVGEADSTRWFDAPVDAAMAALLVAEPGRR